MKALPRSPIAAPPLRHPCAPLTSCIPACHKPGVNRFGLLDPASFLVTPALEVVGVRGSFLSAGRLVTGLELEITQLPGVQCRTCPEVVLVSCQQMPDQDGELACRRDSSDVLAAPTLHPKKKATQRAWGTRCGPARARARGLAR